MIGPRAPLGGARLVVGLTVRALPTWEDRLRYRAEFLADLQGLTPADQMRYAAGVLSQTFALRAALGASPARSEEDVMEQRSNFWRVFRCRILRWHDYRQYSNSDGARYSACSVCDREANSSGYNTIGL
jgi:hypothetical protein